MPLQLLLRRCIQQLDECEWEPLEPTEPSGACRCTRCGEHLDEALPAGGRMMCPKGRVELIGYSFYCPGCDMSHRFLVKAPDDEPGADIWVFNGKEHAPTFSPSLRYDPKDRDGHACHLHLVDGVILYFHDCTHPYRGMKVPLRPFPASGGFG